MLLPLVGCTPDSFSYGSGGEAQACDGDACSEACPVGSHAVEGVCVFECGAWDVTEPQAAALGLALGSDRLYVVGSANEDAGRPALGWLTALSACTGSEDAAALVGNSAAEVAASGDSVCVAGSSADQALIAKLDSTLQAPPSESLVTGGTLSRVTSTSSGFWAVGASDADTAWAVKSSAQGQCSVAFGSVPSHAVDVAARDDVVTVLLDTKDGPTLARFVDSSCAPPSCDCSPSDALGPLSAEGLGALAPAALALGETAIFVAGALDDGAFVMAVDPSSGAVTAARRAAGTQGARSLTVSGDDLWLGGEGGGFAFVQRYRLPLGQEPEWQWQSTDYPAVVSLVSGTAAGELYWLAAGLDSYRVVHCFDDTSCSVF